jgi:hypothetical protein
MEQQPHTEAIDGTQVPAFLVIGKSILPTFNIAFVEEVWDNHSTRKVLVVHFKRDVDARTCITLDMTIEGFTSLLRGMY